LAIAPNTQDIQRPADEATPEANLPEPSGIGFNNDDTQPLIAETAPSTPMLDVSATTIPTREPATSTTKDALAHQETQFKQVLNILSFPSIF